MCGGESEPTLIFRGCKENPQYNSASQDETLHDTHILTGSNENRRSPSMTKYEIVCMRCGDNEG